MSYNGSGTFQINTSGQPVVTGTIISSTAFNALTADLATGLSTAITKDGQTATTVRIPFAQGINSSLATDTTSGSTGSIFTAGGVGITKGLFVGTTLNYGGVTLSAAVTGTGKMVLDTSPTLVTPALGTPSSGVMTNVTGINYNGFKNRIINGAMVIDQRNAGTEVNPAVAAAYYLDRWLVGSTVASKFKIGQNAGAVTPPTGYINYLGCTSLSAYTVGASEVFSVQQKIEGLNVADLAFGAASAATVTLSFWVYSSLTGTFGGSLRNSAQTRSYPFTYTISSANTWTQASVTIAGDTTGTWLTTNGVGITVTFSLGAGATVSGTAGAWATANYASATGAVSVVGTSGATFYITGVQLEKGSTATSFDYRPYGTEMSLCQRYYWKFGGSTLGGQFMPVVLMNAISTTSVSGYIQLPARARTAPTSITLGGTAPAISGGIITTNMALDRSSTDGVMTVITGTGFVTYSTYRWLGSTDATTYLEFLGMEL